MADNTPVTSALHMDRSTPLGNSEDVSGRRALHTIIQNFATNPGSIKDTVEIFGLSVLLTVTTTAQEIKVDITRDPRRRFIYLQVQGSTRVLWGFAPTSCVFTAPNNAIIILAIGDVPVYIKTTMGTANVATGEAG